MRISFVCTGNICRSPTAHWVMVHKLRDAGLEGAVEVVSAGTHAHVGWPADGRSERVAAARGYTDIARHRAAQLVPADYNACDLLLAMDAGHLAHMRRQAPAHARKLRLLCDYAPHPHAGAEVEDPYYDGSEAFAVVADQVEAACDGLVATIVAALEADDPAAALLSPVAPAPGAGRRGGAARDAAHGKGAAAR